MNHLPPPPPTHFSSGGGYQGYGYHHHHNSNSSAQSAQNYEHEMTHHEQLPPSRSRDNLPQHHGYNSSSQHHQNMMREDEEFRQLVAQRMLSSQPVATPNSRHNQHHEHGLRRRDTFDYGFDEISESQLIPPWEVDYSHTSNDGGGRRGMQSYPEQSDVRDEINMDTPHHLMSTNNTYEINTNNIATDAPNTPTTPKFVSFGTHDKIHHFDDQLDQLKFVDEEFLSLAHFLLEVVGVGSVLNGDED
eukprot:scaffold10322_cov110-Alexandrium_tamarense.AAC.1